MYREMVGKLKSKIEYFNENSTMRVFNHVTTTAGTPFLDRLFWLIIFLCCFYGAETILRGSLSVYSQDAVSYSVETDYLEWSTPFPGVTLCELHDDDKVERVLQEFKPVETEYGLCFTFNNQLQYNDRELYISRKESLPKLTFITQELTVVKIHSPQNVVAAARGKSSSTCGSPSNPSNFEIILRAEQTVTDDTVHSISQHSRDCLFKDELPDTSNAVYWPFQQYTYDSCLWYCTAMAQARLCNCTHHFMPRLKFDDETVPVCSLIGLKCLYKNRDLLTNLDCDCPMDCDEIEYRIVHIFCSSSSEDERGKGTKGVVRVGQLPSLRIRRHPIRDILGLFGTDIRLGQNWKQFSDENKPWMDSFVNTVECCTKIDERDLPSSVDFGGVISAFFGASLLSFLEIVYIFFIR